jgi:hypothetical protein
MTEIVCVQTTVAVSSNIERTMEDSQKQIRKALCRNYQSIMFQSGVNKVNAS